jgi:aspartyl/asparaginyl beta-hydroxylase (cupin superfamily)
MEDSGRGRSWLDVVYACRARGDEEGEEHAISARLAVEKRDLRALLAMGELLARRGDERAATTFFRMSLKIASGPSGYPSDTVAQIKQAQGFVQCAEARFAQSIRARLGQYSLARGRVSERVSQAIRLLLGEIPVELQQPTMFYFPGLPQRTFFDRSEFAWLPEFEAHTDAIEREVRAIMTSETAGFTPHTVPEPRVPPASSPLLNDPRWSAFHLWQRGRELRDHTARVPRTIQALALPPIPRIKGFAPMIMFSLLRPGTHIPPHYGSTNTRLICHLPIIVPEGCEIRVGNETRSWSRGRGLIFDDSFQHEAWNRGSGTRVVLLFEIWRPDISQAERDELTALFEAVELSAMENAVAA